MTTCKICGGSVKNEVTFHPACWETAAGRVMDEFCDRYCKWPQRSLNQEDLHELHCNSCPLERLMNLGTGGNWG